VIFFWFPPLGVSKFGDFFSLAKLVDFTNEKKKQNFPNFLLVQEMTKFVERETLTILLRNTPKIYYILLGMVKLNKL